MKKPQFQWQTARHRAKRESEHPGGDWADDPRAEGFTLVFDDGREGRAVCGLRHQWVDDVGATDPDLKHAMRCWLAARGVRSDPEPFEVADLGDAPPDATPQRVVTLAPSNAEMVDALGSFGRVVACENSSDFPEAVESLERLGPDLGPDLDRVAALKPDLVVSSLSVPGMERVVTGLRSRGLRQIVLAPRSFADVQSDATRLGRALHAQEQAQRLVARLQGEHDALLAQRTSAPVRVYLEWWPRPMYTPGGDCYSRELIELAGGTNVFGDRSGSSVEITAEELRAADPDVCFVSWCGVAEDKLDAEGLGRRPGLADLRAAQQGRVFALDERYSGRPGPRMLEASRRMAAAIRSCTS